MRGWAIVTGASSGIGEAFARALAKRGYSLLLVARRHDRLQKLADELGRAEVFVADLSREPEVERVAQRAAALGDVTLLVNNAGFGTRGPFADMDGARQGDMVKLNILTPVLLTHQLLPLLHASGTAERAAGVINISSIGAFQPTPYMATYCASKAFVLSWSEALSEELRGSRVRVLCVCPGPTTSEFFDVAVMPDHMRRLPHTMTADDVVSRTLDAFDDSRAVLLPGVVNWLSAFATRLVPRALSRVLTARMFAPKPPAPALPPHASAAQTEDPP
jgi:hypothetical protein